MVVKMYRANGLHVFFQEVAQSVTRLLLMESLEKPDGSRAIVYFVLATFNERKYRLFTIQVSLLCFSQCERNECCRHRRKVCNEK